MKITQRDLEFQILKYLLTDKIYITKARLYNISPEHFVWLMHEPKEGKKPVYYTRLLFKMIIKYFNDGDSLLTYEVLENKLIDIRANDEVKSNFNLLWSMVQEEEVDENNFYEWITQLRKNLAVRTTNEIFQEGYNVLTQKGLEATINLIEDKISVVKNQISNEPEIQTSFDFASSADIFKNEYTRRLSEPEKYTGIPCGLSEIDNKTFGWQGSQIVVVLGPSSGGKSTQLLNWANYAWKQNKNILYFSFEMDWWTCMLRHISLYYEVQYDKIKGLKLTNNEMNAIIEKMQEGKTSYFEYETSTTNATPKFIDTKIRELANTKGMPHLIIIDAIPHMTTEKSIRSGAKAWERAGDVVEELHMTILKKYNIPILTAQQLNTPTIRETRKMKQEGKARVYYQDASAGDSRLMHYAQYAIAMEPDKDQEVCIYHPVKMRDAWFHPFVAKWCPEYNAVYEFSTEDQIQYKKLLGLIPEDTESHSSAKSSRKSNSASDFESSNDWSDDQDTITEDDLVFPDLNIG